MNSNVRELTREPVPGSLTSYFANATSALLLAAFSPGEGIRICLARTNDDGREIPKDAGITLTREDWLTKLDTARGDPNQFLRSTDRNGIFIGINP